MKNASLRQLRIFASAARHLSFVRAADEMHVTPPAISMQIKELEEEIGMPLFDRSNRQLTLTTVGEYVLAHTRKILATLKDAEDTVAKLKGVTIGDLAIGMVGTASHFVPKLMADFRQDHPGIRMSLKIGNRVQLEAMLRNAEVDLAIMGRPPKDWPTHAEPFAEHPLVLITHPDHPFAKAKEISSKQLQQESFIMRENGSGSRAALEKYFSNNRLTPHIAMEMSSNEAIKQAVMAGMGVSVLSSHTIALEQRLGMLALPEVEGLPIIRQWQLIHNHGKQLSPSAEALRYFILENAEKQIKKLGELPTT